MTVLITAIQFNHDPNSAQISALNLRKNAGEFFPLPEWRLKSAMPLRDSAAAYAINQVRGQTIQIKAQFQRTTPEIATVQVRAVNAKRFVPHSLQQSLSDLAQLLWFPQYFTSTTTYIEFIQYVYYYYALVNAVEQASMVTTGNVLGEVKPTTITFDANNSTGAVSLELQNTQLAIQGVGIYPVSWLWQYRLNDQDTWKDIGITEHLIYATLDLPTAPWTQAPFVAANTQLPWADVLEVACVWAAGTKTVDAAARRITESTNELGHGMFEYGCMVGGAELYTSTIFDSFDCTAFLNRLQGGLGNGRYLNCSDCATIVSTFANILGCDLWQSRMGEYVPIFAVNPVMTIGSQAWHPPCGVWAGFAYHEVAWTGLAIADDTVYDASLAVDADSRPDLMPHQRLLPTNMRFGEVGDGQYRDRLATPSSRELCRPRPEERRRRKVY